MTSRVTFNLLNTGWRAKLAYSIVCSVVLCSATYFALPTQLAKCNLYMFLASAMYLQLPGALEYWYTGSFACTRSSTWNITHPGECGVTDRQLCL